MAKIMTYPAATPRCWSSAANITSRAMGTGIRTETRLTKPIFQGFGSARSDCQGIWTSIAADRRLARSMIVIVGLTSIQTFRA